MARKPKPPPAEPLPAAPPPPRRRSHAGRIVAAVAAAATATGLGVGLYHSGKPTAPKVCQVSSIDPKLDQPLRFWAPPAGKSCKPIQKGAYLLPDPKCTPGAVNPTLTLTVLKDKTYSTGPCVRDKATSASRKSDTYGWYDLVSPPGNTGKTQTCEKDHLISLELGGSDTLDNIWPQCGPDNTVLNQRNFKQKDMVENYLAAQVRSGAVDLGTAQHGIASDWTQYLQPAKDWYAKEGGIKNDDEG